MSKNIDWSIWEPQFSHFIQRAAPADAAHDPQHTLRVVANARMLAAQERADLAVVLPAAWLHDCVSVAKDSPLRGQASRLAGRAAVEFLEATGYPAQYLPAIQHAIEAHSFSANIAPRTREAMVVQDADRLDALGAVGLARCLMLSGALGRRLYDPLEPFPASRPLDEQANAIDHSICQAVPAGRSHYDTGGPGGGRQAHQLFAYVHRSAAQRDSDITVTCNLLSATCDL